MSKQQSRMFFTANGGPVFALDHGDPGDHDPQGPGSDWLELEVLGRRVELALASEGHADLYRQIGADGAGNFDGALADLDRAITLLPANADVVAMHALFNMLGQHPDKALADLETALRMDPSHAIARMTRAAIYTEQGANDKALQDLGTLGEQLAPQSDGRQTLATQYDKLAMPAEALAQWNLWIANHPSDPHLGSAYSGRCWAREELGVELDEALDDCQKAVAADTKNTGFLVRRGWVYLRTGNARKALADFDGVIAMTADPVFSLYGRGLAHLALGENAAAQADFAAARHARPDIDDAIRKDGLPLAPPP